MRNGMTHILVFTGLAWFACIHSISAQDRISESFDDPAATAFKLIPSDWVVSDGILKTRNTSNRVVSFELGKQDWRDYELFFKVKRLSALANSHFGIVIQPRPGTESRFYCRGKSVLYRNIVDKKELFHADIGMLSKPMMLGESSAWTTFRIAVKNGSAIVTVDGVPVGTASGVAQGMISFSTAFVDVALDEIDISVFTVGERIEKIVSANIIRNSGFEQCTIDDRPDFWGCHHWGISDPVWVTNFDEWTRRYRADDTVAYEGKRSMRIDFPFDTNASRNGVFSLISTCLGTTAGKQYTLSAYMKSESAGMKVKLGEQECTLTTDWKRYITMFSNNGKSLYEDKLYLYPVSKGVFWADAVQLEEGIAATPYSAMTGDDPMVTEEGNVEKTVAKVPECRPLAVPGKEITLDGVLDEGIWKNAERLELIKLNGDRPAESTEAYIVYSETGIYIGVVSHEENAEAHLCKETKREGLIWNDPSVEIFIDPSLSRNYYYHLGFNRNGVPYDAYIGDMSWNGSWKVATRTEKDRWTAEVFLPFGDFGLAKAFGQRWGINICRNNPVKKENLCWSPTYGSFHSPARFGQIVLLETVLSAHWFKCADAGVRRTSSGMVLGATVVNDTPADGYFFVSATIRMADGIEKQFGQQVSLTQGASQEIDFGAVDAVDAAFPVKLSFYSADRTRLLSTVSRKIIAPRIFEAQLQYDLYTTESALTLRARNDLDAGSQKKASISMTITNAGGVAAKQDVRGLLPVMDIAVNISAVPEGNYTLSAILHDGTREVGRVERQFRKRNAKPYEVKVDHLRRMVTANGKPYMPAGLYWEGTLTDEVIDYIAKNGSSAIHLDLDRKPSDVERKILDHAAQSGVRIVGWLHAKEKGKTRAYIDRFKDHPAILAWMVFDEQFTVPWGKEHYSTIVDTCAELQELDPWHPVYINDNQYGISYLKTKGLGFPGSIISLDYYVWVPAGSFSATVDNARIMEEMGRDDGRPSWFWLLGAGYTFWAGRDYTPAEQEFSTYACLINGVTGFWWLASHPKSKSGWETIKRMWAELAKLTPVIASTRTVRGITAAAPAVQMMVKEFDGALFLITLNTSPYSVSSTFDVSAFLKNGTSKVVFEDRTISVMNGIFEDKFNGYQRHVYRIVSKH